jgi:hypothetical protein
MADPTLGLTFQDLITRVAETIGLAYYGAAGNQVAQNPVDVHDLDVCKRLVNDGYRRFINSNPRWSFLTPTFTLTLAPGYTGTATSVGTQTTLTDTTRTEAAGAFIGQNIAVTHAATGLTEVGLISNWNSGTKVITFAAIVNPVQAGDSYQIAPTQCVNGDNSRYYLPDGFYGSLLTPFTFAANAGVAWAITDVREEILREMQQTVNTSGDPSYVAFRPLPALPTTNGKRWEAIFWPDPTTLRVITARARLYPDALLNLTDRHICGFEFDEAVLAAACAEADRQRNDSTGIHEQKFQDALGRAILIDKQSVERRLGDYGDKSEGRYAPRPHGYTGVDTYNGVSI